MTSEAQFGYHLPKEECAHFVECRPKTEVGRTDPVSRAGPHADVDVSIRAGHELFHMSSSYDDILVIAHSLCLTHLGRAGRHDERDQPLCMSMIQIYKNVEGDISYFPKREQVGLCLVTRSTCRTALTYCSKWYSEVVGREVGLLVQRRFACEHVGRI